MSQPLGLRRPFSARPHRPGPTQPNSYFDKLHSSQNVERCNSSPREFLTDARLPFLGSATTSTRPQTAHPRPTGAHSSAAQARQVYARPASAQARPTSTRQSKAQVRFVAQPQHHEQLSVSCTVAAVFSTAPESLPSEVLVPPQHLPFSTDHSNQPLPLPPHTSLSLSLQSQSQPRRPGSAYNGPRPGSARPQVRSWEGTSHTTTPTATPQTHPNHPCLKN